MWPRAGDCLATVRVQPKSGAVNVEWSLLGGQV